MNLLDAISRRGDIPNKNGPQPFPATPMRGQMPWQSGFEGHQRNALMELMQMLQQRQQLQGQMATRHMQVPTVGPRGR